MMAVGIGAFFLVLFFFFGVSGPDTKSQTLNPSKLPVCHVSDYLGPRLVFPSKVAVIRSHIPTGLGFWFSYYFSRQLLL